MEDEAIKALRAVTDPLERARQAHELFTEAVHIRDEAITELVQSGAMNATTIAGELGISRQRVSQIVAKDPEPERAWWGPAKKLTAVVGRKTEAAKEAAGEAGPVVAAEDVHAVTMLRDHFLEVDASITTEEVPPPGLIDLNRDGLIVICGPRLSPIVRQVIAADPDLGFAKDGRGWFIADRRTGREWHSPLDDGECSDIGYLARVRRPDRRGTFIYMAGIHAAGEAGAVHYLIEGGGLGEVWRSEGDRQFSTLIRCTFDRDSRAITSSERVTPLYRKEA